MDGGGYRRSIDQVGIELEGLLLLLLVCKECCCIGHDYRFACCLSTAANEAHGPLVSRESGLEKRQTAKRIWDMSSQTVFDGQEKSAKFVVESVDIGVGGPSDVSVAPARSPAVESFQRRNERCDLQLPSTTHISIASSSQQAP